MSSNKLSQAEAERISKIALTKLFSSSGNAVILQIDMQVFVALVSQLQLAFRHPRNNGASREMIEKFLRHIIEKIDPNKTEIYQFFMMGFDQNYDVIQCQNCKTDIIVENEHCPNCKEKICRNCGRAEEFENAARGSLTSSGVCLECVDNLGADYIDY